MLGRLQIQLLVAAALLHCVASQTTHAITTSGLTFSPNSITIVVGDSITWSSLSPSHNVVQTTTAGGCTATTSGFMSGSGVTDLSVSTYTRAFNTVGTFWYKCNPHCGAGMTGTVIVTTAAPTAAPSTAPTTATPTAAPTNNFAVTTSGLTFSPNSVDIAVGDTVTWSNLSPSHNVVQTTTDGGCTATTSGFMSGSSVTDLTQSTYTRTFPTAGTYYYKCNPHCGAGMTAKVVVSGTTTNGATRTGASAVALLLLGAHLFGGIVRWG